MPNENDPLFIIGQTIASMMFAAVITGAFLIAYHAIKTKINRKWKP